MYRLGTNGLRVVFVLTIWLRVLFFGEGGVPDWGFSRNFFSFLLFGAGGGVGLVGGVGGGVRCRLCL